MWLESGRSVRVRRESAVDAYVIVLRILHIVAGVFWVGAAALVTFFLEPVAKELGPAAGPFMGEVTGKRKLPIVISVAAIVNVVAGILLYWEASNGFDPDWIGTGPGIGFTVGGIAAIVGLILGVGFIRPRFARLGAIGAEAQASGGPPSQSQMEEVQRLNHVLKRLGMTVMTLLAIAVVAMAIARYL